MASSSTVSAGDTATATQYNNLRTDALTREFFAPVNETDGASGITHHNAYVTANIRDGADVHITFVTPDDFSSITEAVVVGIPTISAGTPSSTMDIDIATVYATNGESYTTHTESDTSSTYDFSASEDEITEIDISGLLSSLAAGDYVGVEVENNDADTFFNIMGVRIKYSGA